jgi:sigma-E factor negative regulatory protein RseA
MDDLNSISNAERISALMDGELSPDECKHLLGEVLEDTQSINTWHAYQVVGDVLRSPELAPNQSEMAFLKKLEQRLSQEPQRPFVVPDEELSSALKFDRSARFDIEKPMANAPVFRWKVLAGAACLALVAVMGGGLWNQAEVGGGGGEVANVKPVLSAQTVVVAAESPVGPMLRDPRLDELMAAHRQLGGHSALQVPAGFLRNATYEGVGR